MKKVLLSLGSALAIFGAVNVAKAEDMSFGISAGAGAAGFMDGFDGSKLEKGGGKNGDEAVNTKLNFPYGGGAFFEYRVVEDTVAAGIYADFKRRSIALNVKDMDMTFDCVDIAILGSWLPMGYEDGLAIQLGPKMYLPISASCNGKDTKDELNGFGIGAQLGVRYEVMESGLLVGLDTDYFFSGIFDAEKADKVDEDRKFLVDALKPMKFFGANLSVGYDFARLME